MPFIEQKNRKLIDAFGPSKCVDVGDICYVFYKEMVRRWREDPRWRTIHRLKKAFVSDASSDGFVEGVIAVMDDSDFELEDILTASYLAFDVFFQKYAMPYEQEKILQNGDI